MAKSSKKRSTASRVREAPPPLSRRLLLDTHVWLWWQADDPRLGRAAGVSKLPALHGDPFDRMLISQALTEGLTLVSADPQLEGYGAGLISALT